MADEFSSGTNWWDSSRTAGSSSSSSGLNNSFGWATEMADIKTASSSGSSVVFQDNQKLQAMDLQMVGLGLSSQAMDWNQSLLRGEKSEAGFRSMLQDHSLSTSNAHYQQQPSSFPMDSTAALYGSPSTILQGLLGSENQQQQYENRSIGYQYGTNTNDQLLPNSWSKVPQFLRSSPPKHHHHHHHHQQQQHQLHGQLHFSNNAPFWNPSPMADHVRPGFFTSSQTQFPAGNFDEKPKNISQVRDSSTVVKKSGNEPTSKRPRSETPSTMPAFKVRKEKMGDRITALQQLVSPFGKTDTASVLSEAIEYIKFLHEQVNVLSTPYMKNNEAAIQHRQNPEKSKDPEGPKQDLRSRGLCLVPVSSTFPLTHDSPVDFWTPTFGGTFR